jgi:hypothetical protein
LENIGPTEDQSVDADTMEAQFFIEWDVIAVIARRRELGLETDIRNWLTVTGNSYAAQLETVARYFDQTWPSNGQALLSDLQQAVISFPGKMASSLLHL